MTSPQDGHIDEGHNPENTEVKCPTCGNQYVPLKRGLHNWKNLFRRPRLDDWLTLLIIAMAIFSYYAYLHDTAECRQIVADQVNFYNQMVRDNNAWRSNISLESYKLNISIYHFENATNESQEG